MKANGPVFLIFILMICLLNSVHPQSFSSGEVRLSSVKVNKQFPEWWVNGTFLGATTIAESGLFSLYTSLNYTYDKRIFKLRYLEGGEFLNFDQTPNISAWECALLWGLYINNGRTSISIMTGLGYIEGVERGNLIEEQFLGDLYEKRTYHAPGIPFEIQFNINAFKYAGANIVLYMNANLKKTIAGINFSLILGNLK